MRLLFGNYLEGALYRPRRTYHLAHRAPSGAQPALYLLIYLDLIINEHQNLTGAHLHTKSAAVALTSVDFRHSDHLSPVLQTAIV